MKLVEYFSIFALILLGIMNCKGEITQLKDDSLNNNNNKIESKPGLKMFPPALESHLVAGRKQD